MGEREILKILLEQRDFMTAKHLTDIIDGSYGSIRHCLKQMRKYNVVIHKMVKIKGREVFFYAHTH